MDLRNQWLKYLLDIESVIQEIEQIREKFRGDFFEFN
jgi:hypothetical protein